MNQACPICGSNAFADFNERMAARCIGCGSLERGRYQWLVLQRMIALPEGAKVAHFAPERFFMDYFSQRADITYSAYDKFPEYYPHERATVIGLDLCTDLATLSTSHFDLVIHSHVLEHLPCAFEPILLGMQRILKPGGHMFFSVPISGEITGEGLDPAQNATERELRARQGEHLRVFGRADFPAIVERLLGADCLVRQGDLFSDAQLAEANIPIARKGEPTGKSVFLYQKP